MENGLLNHVVGREGSYVPNSRDAVPGRSCMKVQRSLDKHVLFSSDVKPGKDSSQYIQPTIIENASEDRFLQALIYGKLDECKTMHEMGLSLPDNDLRRLAIRSVLMMPKEEAEPRIRFLMKHQYHVFTQSNDVFSGISVENAEFIAKNYPKFASVRNQLFRESLNDSQLNFENSFYRVHVQTAVEWINSAREAGRHDVIKKIVRYVSFLYDESTGESVLFHAIKHLDL